MDAQRTHILGGGGTGTTTLGRCLATEWSVPHADTDDFFWVPTDPPYTTKRDPADRLALMHDVFVARPAWVLTGSLMSWGDELIEHFDAVIFLTLDPGARMERLRARERRRYGRRVEPGGDREQAMEEFLDWAAGYDDPTFGGRSRARHEEWLAGLRCPVLRLDSAAPTDRLVERVLDWMPGS